MDSFKIDFRIGSREHDFVGEAMMIRRTPSTETFRNLVKDSSAGFNSSDLAFTPVPVQRFNGSNSMFHKFRMDSYDTFFYSLNGYRLPKY